MKVVSFTLENFGSYKHIKFDMFNSGLTLIQGPTGSGKSTLCDAIPWALFGCTAKGGAVDEVLSWHSDEPTTCSIKLQIHGFDMYVVRTRSNNKNNDLYYCVDGDMPQRGKDVTDTQKRINQLLGFDDNLYLSGAYFHEFSQVAQFFTTNAKNRRTICEQLVDLTKIKLLQTEAADSIKALKKSKESTSATLANLANIIAMTKKQLISEQQKAATFTQTQERRLEDAKAKYEVFETSRQERLAKAHKVLAELNDGIQPREKFHTTIQRLQDKLDKLGTETCPTCGAFTKSSEREDITASMHLAEKRRINNNTLISNANIAAHNIKQIEAETNPYEHTLLEIVEQENTHKGAIAPLELELNELLDNQHIGDKALFSYIEELCDTETLTDVLAAYRADCIERTIVSVQDTSNDLISKHFDGEIRLNLAVEAADKLDVTILKDGNSCAYTQLSKGQRCILKLCFSVAVMKTIALHNSVQFNALWFDEALDGLDSNFKVKALKMFEELALGETAIFLVEHSTEVKALVDNQIDVRLENGYSVINE